ncbi:MAG: FlgD immunoglobulin-like domain containing protein [Candidatus Krumholzibacteriia bacterium]
MTSLFTRLLTGLLVLVLAGTAAAQWPPSASDNLLVGGGPGEQVVPRLAIVPAGGGFTGFSYIGWYSNASGNYDVALQLLDTEGMPMFAPGGIIVSDQPQNTWVMDWSLAAGAGGFAVVAFADIRDGNSNIHVYRIDPDGSHAWGPDGITLTSDSDFKGPPCVAVTSDAEVVVVWMQSGATTALRMQRLAADGTVLLAAGGVPVSDASDLSPAGNLLVPTDDGDVILGYVPTYSFSGNRQVKAQRFDAAGQPVWPSPVMVMDDATLPMGHYFDLTADGEGGALFCWDIVVGTAFDARVQRLSAAGMEMLAHNGRNPEAAGPAGQIEPSAVYDPATGAITMVYIDMNSSQSQRGLFAQRFDLSGNRLWGAAGKVLLPQDPDLEVAPALGLVQGAVIGLVEHEPGGAYGQDRILAYRLDDAGDLMWGGAIEAASTPSSKGRLMAANNGLTLVGVWEDDRNGTPDVYSQNVNTDGSLGAAVVAIEDEPTVPAAPTAFAARPAYPNPFNPSTTIAFDLPRSERVTLRIFNAAGVLVRELVDGVLPARSHQVTWDGTDNGGRRVPSGVYYYHLACEDRVATRALTLVK